MVAVVTVRLWKWSRHSLCGRPGSRSLKENAPLPLKGLSAITKASQRSLRSHELPPVELFVIVIFILLIFRLNVASWFLIFTFSCSSPFFLFVYFFSFLLLFLASLPFYVIHLFISPERPVGVIWTSNSAHGRLFRRQFSNRCTTCVTPQGRRNSHTDTRLSEFRRPHCDHPAIVSSLKGGTDVARQCDGTLLS